MTAPRPRIATSPDGVDAILDAITLLLPAQGLLELRLLPQAGLTRFRPRRLWVPLHDRGAQRTALAPLLERNATAPSLLAFGVNPRIRRGGKDEDVVASSTVVIDVDGKGQAHAEQRRKLSLVKQRAPTALVLRSGSPGNLHLYWRLDPPCEPDRAKEVTLRLRLWIDADSSESPSRVMRLPGSFNWKTGKPVPVTWVSRRRSVTIDQLEAAMEEVGVPAALPSRGQRRGAPRRTCDDIAPPTCPAIDPDRWVFIKRALPAWAVAMILRGRDASDRYESRSQADAAVCRALVDLGATDDEIRFFFVRTPEGIGARFHERHAAGAGDDYLERTITFVRKAAEEHIDDVALVKVNKIWAMRGRPRVGLEVEVRTGHEAGETIKQGVEATGPIWRYLWLSAGLEPMPSAAAKEAGRLRGRLLRVRLDVRGDGLQIDRWLPMPVPPEEEE